MRDGSQTLRKAINLATADFLKTTDAKAYHLERDGDRLQSAIYSRQFIVVPTDRPTLIRRKVELQLATYSELERIELAYLFRILRKEADLSA